MEIASSIIVDIWEYFGDFIPASKKEDSLCALIEMFVNHNVDDEWFDLIRGVDRSIDNALSTVLDDEEVTDYEDQDEDF